MVQNIFSRFSSLPLWKTILFSSFSSLLSKKGHFSRFSSFSTLRGHPVISDNRGLFGQFNFDQAAFRDQLGNQISI